jgi:prephenate dehydratase
MTAGPAAAPRRAGRPAAGLRVAFQGELGAYSEEALQAWWRGAAEPVPARECADVAAAVADGLVDAGLLAVENTLAGSVVPTYDALAATDGLCVVGEVVLAIRHCVLAPPGATLAGLRSLETHPIALAQCRRFLAAHPHIAPRAAYDTAGSARAVAESGDVRRAALAGRGAARRFGLAVLASAVEDRSDNQTRFLVLARAGDARAQPTVAPGTPARTALIATAENAPGTLVRLLAPLAAAGLNVAKLEARPTGVPWTYRFFVEVEHAAGHPALLGALDEVRGAARALRVLGTFARAGHDD